MQFLGKERVPIYGWTEGVSVEEKALQQVRNVASMPFIHHHVAVMPDCHWGMGATVGSVIPTVGAIIPAAVGVDIGCGMMAQRTSIRAEHLPDSLADIRNEIEAAVPHGRTDNGGTNDRGAWGELLQKNVERFAKEPVDEDATLASWLGDIVEKHPGLERASGRALNHLGTLGTGNHFIELCLDESGFLWIMLHSGSRGIGNKIGTHFIEKAKEEMRRWYINLPDEDLAYLPEGSTHFADYINAVQWAQEFAAENRRVMMDAVVAVIRGHFPDMTLQQVAVNCHHNYVTKEKHYGKNVWLTRKGAVQAREGTLGIIPRLHGRQVIHRAWQGQPRVFP